MPFVRGVVFFNFYIIFRTAKHKVVAFVATALISIHTVAKTNVRLTR